MNQIFNSLPDAYDILIHSNRFYQYRIGRNHHNFYGARYKVFQNAKQILLMYVAHKMTFPHNKIINGHTSYDIYGKITKN
jgi:hypothetical protein